MAPECRHVDPGATVIVKNPAADGCGFFAEGTQVSDERRTAQRNAGAFLPPDLGGGGGMIPVPVNAESLGPGKPGLEDEWKIPAGPEADAEIPGEPTPEPALAGPRPGLLHRLTHRG